MFDSASVTKPDFDFAENTGKVITQAQALPTRLFPIGVEPQFEVKGLFGAGFPDGFTLHLLARFDNELLAQANIFLRIFTVLMSQGRILTFGISGSNLTAKYDADGLRTTMIFVRRILSGE
jgi:hypothetical protein